MFWKNVNEGKRESSRISNYVRNEKKEWLKERMGNGMFCGEFPFSEENLNRRISEPPKLYETILSYVRLSLRRLG